MYYKESSHSSPQPTPSLLVLSHASDHGRKSDSVQKLSRFAARLDYIEFTLSEEGSSLQVQWGLSDRFFAKITSDQNM